MKIVRILSACAAVGLAAACSSTATTTAATTAATTATTSATAAKSSPARTAAGGGTPTAAADCTHRIGTTLCFHVRLSGAATVDQPAVGGTGKSESCAEWLKGTASSSGRKLDLATISIVLPAPAVSMGDLTLTGYTGPGSYPLDQVSSEGGFSMVVDAKEYGLNASYGTTGSVTVNADASGTITLKNLMTQNAAPPRPSVDAVISWTCAA